MLHRHSDAQGPHLDLRLEQRGYLTGFRIDATAIDGETWAEEKSPHPVEWLDRDGEAIREDSGTYVVERVNGNELRVTLHGARAARTIHAVQEPGLSPGTTRDVCAVLREQGVSTQDAAKYIADGITARRRTVERLCGLARELDASTFDETVSKRSLAGLSLEEIHTQLRAYEVRFDAKYPPAPVSQPEQQSESERATGTATALAIVRGIEGT